VRNASAALLGVGAGFFFHALRRVLWVLFWPRTGEGVVALALLGAGVGAAAGFLMVGRGGRKEDRAVGVHLLWGLCAAAALAVFGGLSVWPVASQGAAVTALSAFLLGVPAAVTAAALCVWKEEPEKARATGIFLASLGAGLVAAAVFPCLHPRVVAAAGIVLGTLPAVLVGGGERTPRSRATALVFVTAAAFLASPSVTPFETQAAAPAGADETQGWSREEAVWCGLSRVESATHRAGRLLLSVNGGLREMLVRPGRRVKPAVPVSRGEDGSLDVLVVGFPGGEVVPGLMRKKEVSLTIVEPDGAVASRVVERWPELKAAREEGNAVVLVENPRRFLERTGQRYDVIVLAAPSPAAHLSGALAFEEEYLYTEEAFRSYDDHLAPRGLLLVRRAGNGRVVSTLREAVGGGTGPAFAERVAVVGSKGRLVSDLYYRPSGFSETDLDRLSRVVRKAGAEIFYSPRTTRKWNLYFSLVRGERRGGYYFSSPQDLTPARDDRPFFDHFERLMISPTGPPLPEERGRLSGGWTLQFVPRGDSIFWAVLLSGIVLLPAAVLLPLGVYHHRTGLARHALPAWGLLFLSGMAAAACLRAVLGYSRWFEPFPGNPGWAAGLAFIGAGAGWWAGSVSADRRGGALLRLAALTGLFGVAGYPLGRMLLSTGPEVWAVFVGALAFGAGTIAGAAVGGAQKVSVTVFPGSGPVFTGAVAYGATLSWAVSNLLAVTFGFPLLWLTAAALSLWALRAGRGL